MSTEALLAAWRLLLAILPPLASPPVATIECSASERVAMPGADTLAVSASASAAGRHATMAARRGGRAPAVSEEEIAVAVRDLWPHRFPTEPTSALTLACLRRAVADGVLGDAPPVALLTSGRIGWKRDLARGLAAAGLRAGGCP